jgi:hypothetical protein
VWREHATQPPLSTYAQCVCVCVCSCVCVCLPFVLERAGRHILSGESALGVFLKPSIELTIELVMNLLLAWSYEISCVRCTRRHWAQRVEEEGEGAGVRRPHMEAERVVPCIEKPRENAGLNI